MSVTGVAVGRISAGVALGPDASPDWVKFRITLNPIYENRYWLLLEALLRDFLMEYAENLKSEQQVEGDGPQLRDGLYSLGKVKEAGHNSHDGGFLQEVRVGKCQIHRLSLHLFERPLPLPETGRPTRQALSRQYSRGIIFLADPAFPDPAGCAAVVGQAFWAYLRARNVDYQRFIMRDGKEEVLDGQLSKVPKLLW